MMVQEEYTLTINSPQVQLMLLPCESASPNINEFGYVCKYLIIQL